MATRGLDRFVSVEGAQHVARERKRRREPQRKWPVPARAQARLEPGLSRHRSPNLIHEHASKEGRIEYVRMKTSRLSIRGPRELPTS